MITREELDLELAKYEKIGSFSSYAQELDSNIRKMFSNAFSDFEVKMNSKSIKDSSSLVDDVLKLVNDFKSSMLSGLDDKLNSQAIQISKKVEDSVSDQLGNTEKSFSDLLTVNTIQTLREAKEKTEKQLESLFQNLEKITDSKISESEKKISATLEETANSVISNALITITSILQDNIHAHFSKITLLNNELSDFIKIKFSEELIDKKAIDDKMYDVETELKKQIDQIIDFQLQQSRTMMEQSAKAEIKQALQKYK